MGSSRQENNRRHYHSWNSSSLQWNVQRWSVLWFAADFKSFSVAGVKLEEYQNFRVLTTIFFKRTMAAFFVTKVSRHCNHRFSFENSPVQRSSEIFFRQFWIITQRPFHSHSIHCWTDFLEFHWQSSRNLQQYLLCFNSKWNRIGTFQVWRRFEDWRKWHCTTLRHYTRFDEVW